MSGFVKSEIEGRRKSTENAEFSGRMSKGVKLTSQ